MRFPRLLVCEADGRLAVQLRKLAEERRWSLREPRRPEACLRLLRRGGPSVLVLKLSAATPREQTPDPVEGATRRERAWVRELTLLERVGWHCPETATVVVGDAEHAALAGVAWDLGAAYVLFPPWPRDWLPEIVVGLLDAGTARQPASEEPGRPGDDP
jgi:hypothetical protein